jgi:hypothetical protein
MVVKHCHTCLASLRTKHAMACASQQGCVCEHYEQSRAPCELYECMAGGGRVCKRRVLILHVMGPEQWAFRK